MFAVDEASKGARQRRALDVVHSRDVEDEWLRPAAWPPPAMVLCFHLGASGGDKITLLPRCAEGDLIDECPGGMRVVNRRICRVFCRPRSGITRLRS